MDHTLGNTLVVEVKDLLAEMKVVDERWTAGADAQRVLVVGDGAALRRGQGVVSVLGY
jgi:hypothetical protein